LLLQSYPDAGVADAEWDFTEGEFLASWLGPRGPKIYYFYFCDPDDWSAVLFSGVEVPEVRDVLLKRTSLDRYIKNAELIPRSHPQE
jgi:hypothetical protein